MVKNLISTSNLAKFMMIWDKISSNLEFPGSFIDYFNQDGSLWPICGSELAGDHAISTVKGTPICFLRHMSIFGISLKSRTNHT